MMALLSPRLWLALAIAALLAATHGLAYRSGRAAVRAAWDAQTLAAATQAHAAEQAARTAERALAAAAHNSKVQKNAEITRLTAALDAALDSLRHRPERPAVTDLPATAAAGAGCTGAELYRPDGEFLAREAARADTLRAALSQCQAQYTAAGAALSTQAP